MRKLKPKTGRLLISEPNMNDSNFKRSVLILAQHNQEETIGFILNQQTRFKINDLIEDFPNFDARIYIGGPVDKNSLHFIHTLGDKIENSVQDLFDLSPRGIREHLKLTNAIYVPTSAYGHFGREPDNKGHFTWEKTDLVDALKGIA